MTTPLLPSERALLLDAQAISDERACGVPNWDRRMEATFADTKFVRPGLVARGLMLDDGGITPAGRALLEDPRQGRLFG